MESKPTLSRHVDSNQIFNGDPPSSWSNKVFEEGWTSTRHKRIFVVHYGAYARPTKSCNSEGESSAATPVEERPKARYDTYDDDRRLGAHSSPVSYQLGRKYASKTGQARRTSAKFGTRYGVNTPIRLVSSSTANCESEFSQCYQLRRTVPSS